MAYIGQAPANKPVSSSDLEDGLITNSKLAQDIISAETELATAPADTDEFLISDGGVLKRLDASLVGGGKIGQVLQDRKTDSFSTTNGILGTGFTAITGLSQAITPSATTSKILVVCDIMCNESGPNRIYFRLKRDSTFIGNADQIGSGTPCIAASFNFGFANTGEDSVTFSFLDSPNTTSAVTYQPFVCHNQSDGNSTTRINTQANTGNGASDSNSTSSITVYEVLA